MADAKKQKYLSDDEFNALPDAGTTPTDPNNGFQIENPLIPASYSTKATPRPGLVGFMLDLASGAQGKNAVEPTTSIQANEAANWLGSKASSALSSMGTSGGAMARKLLKWAAPAAGYEAYRWAREEMGHN